MDRAGGENFPVASRMLPRRVRAHLLALYGFARLVDTAGDELAGDRLVALDSLESDLERVWHGDPAHPLLRGLAPTVAECGLPIEPFRRLIEANRLDQVKRTYATRQELLSYCALSANPVGELVLGVFGAATPERIARSDAVCSGLQLTEHWQDVAEDHRAGRIYLPAADRERFGVAEVELGGGACTPAFRALMAEEVVWARGLLSDGAPLIGMLSGRASLAVAAFVAGGRSALEAIERAGYDVLGGRPRPGRARRATVLLATLLRRGRG